MRKPSGLSILLGIILGGFFGGLVWYTYRSTLDTNSALLGNSTYVAAFLDTNQVFFGKVGSLSYDYVVLKNVYYLQQVENAGQAGFVLQKSGSELHGPRDEMHINRDHILLIQPLRADSQVIATIKQYEESLKNQGEAQQQPAQAEQQLPPASEVIIEEATE
ncbi:MAG: hypothetical protein AMXMBFR44_1090 [Candidatus Campbellbacteria bacterium]